MSKFQGLAACAVLALGLTYARGGEVKIKFVVVGDAPAPKPLVVGKEPFCAAVRPALVDESIVVGKQGELANVFVYLDATSKPKATPEALARLPKEVVLDNVNCRFEPHAVAIHTSQTLLIGNKDAFGHNAKYDLFSNGGDNVLVPAGGVVKKSFAKGERIPGPVSCNIHPWMTSLLMVSDSPYFGVSGADGVVTIPHLPAGKWKFVVYHRKFLEVTDSAGKKWTKGRVEIDCTQDVDLGVINVPLELVAP